jgi:hypothetical protein
MCLALPALPLVAGLAVILPQAFLVLGFDVAAVLVLVWVKSAVQP